MDYDGTVVSSNPPPAASTGESDEKSGVSSASSPDQVPVEDAKAPKLPKKEKDDELSDTESEGPGSSKSAQHDSTPQLSGTVTTTHSTPDKNDSSQIAQVTHKTEQLSLGASAPQTEQKKAEPVGEISQFKAMAADASVFSFGDDEDDESD